MQLRKEAWKKFRTRDLAITDAMLYQLSYEATEVGSRSIVGSYVPVKEMSVMACNGLETKLSRTFLDLLHLGHEFFIISGHGA